jgi:GTPase SAR1 family protein
VGKTDLILVYTNGDVPDEDIPTFFDTYRTTATVEDRQINLELWDSSGQANMENFRAMADPKAQWW